MVPINCIPLDVLSLVPVHLSSNRDVFRASFVCRHWRRTFIQCAALWSRLYLTRARTDLYVKTLLERSKGTVLDIVAVCNPLHRPGTLALLSPHAQRLGNLDFAYCSWAAIQQFSEVVSGSIPLLQTLKIHSVYEGDEGDELGRGVIALPSLPLFTGAVNLKEFRLRSEGLPFLDHFIFPNLTTLELSVVPEEDFPGSQLLNFLEASPTLRTVNIEIRADALLGDVPLGRVVVLPNVETFGLSMGEDGLGCEIAAHISCPSARLTSLLYEQNTDDAVSAEIFPTSVSWNAIARQYAASPVDEVVLEIMASRNPIITCLLTFLSPGPATLALGFKIITNGDDDDDEELEMLGEWHAEIFSQASMTIRTHPLLANVKRLRIQDKYIAFDPDELAPIASEVRQLFKSVGPLDSLTLNVFDLRPYLAPFLDLPEFRDMDQPNVFPPVKELTIAQPPWTPAKQKCMAAVVELAKSQHTLGVPFEHVTIRLKDPPPEITEWLSPWVGEVHC